MQQKPSQLSMSTTQNLETQVYEPLKIEDFLPKSAEKIKSYNALSKSVSEYLSSHKDREDFFQNSNQIKIQCYYLSLNDFIKKQLKIIDNIKKQRSTKQFQRLQEEFDLNDKYYNEILIQFKKNKCTTSDFLSYNFGIIERLLDSLSASPFSLGRKLDSFYSFINELPERVAANRACSSLEELHERMNQMYLGLSNPNPENLHEIFKANKQLGPRAFFWVTPSNNQYRKYNLNIISSEKMPKILKSCLEDSRLLEWLEDINSIELSLVNDHDAFKLDSYRQNDHVQLNMKQRIIKIGFDFQQGGRYRIRYDFDECMEYNWIYQNPGTASLVINSHQMRPFRKTDFLRNFLETRFFKHIFQKIYLVGFQLDNFKVSLLQTPFLKLISQKVCLPSHDDFSIIFNQEKNTTFLTRDQAQTVLPCLKQLYLQTKKSTKLMILVSDTNMIPNILSEYQKCFGKHFKIPPIIRAASLNHNAGLALSERDFILQVLNLPEFDCQQFTPTSQGRITRFLGHPIQVPLHQQVLLSFKMGNEGLYPKFINEKNIFLNACKELGKRHNRRLKLNPARSSEKYNIRLALSYIELELDTTIQESSDDFFHTYVKENSEEALTLTQSVRRKDFFDKHRSHPVCKYLSRDDNTDANTPDSTKFLACYNKHFFIQKVLATKKLSEHVEKMFSLETSETDKFNFYNFLTTNKTYIFKSTEDFQSFAIKNKELIFDKDNNFEKFLKKNSIKSPGKIDFRKFYRKPEAYPFNEQWMQHHKEINELDSQIKNKMLHRNNRLTYLEHLYKEIIENPKLLLAIIYNQGRLLFNRKIDFLRYLERRKYRLFDTNKDFLAFLYRAKDTLFDDDQDYIEYIQINNETLFDNKQEYLLYCSDLANDKDNSFKKLLPLDYLYSWFKIEIEKILKLQSLEPESFFPLYKEEYEKFCEKNSYTENIEKLTSSFTEKYSSLSSIKITDLQHKPESNDQEQDSYKKELRNALERSKTYIKKHIEYSKKIVFKRLSTGKIIPNYTSYDSVVTHLNNLLLKNADNHRSEKRDLVVQKCINNLKKRYPKKYKEYISSYRYQIYPHNVSIFDNNAITNIIASYLDGAEKGFTTYDRIVWKQAPRIASYFLKHHKIKINNNFDTNELLKISVRFARHDLRVYLILYFLIRLNLLSFLCKLPAFCVFTKNNSQVKKISLQKTLPTYTHFIQLIQKKPSKPPKKNHIKRLVVI